MTQFRFTRNNTSSNGAKFVASPSCPANNKDSSALFSDIALAMSVLFCLVMLICIMLNVILIPCIMAIMVLMCKLAREGHLKAASI